MAICDKPYVSSIFTLILIKQSVEKVNFRGQRPKAGPSFGLELFLILVFPLSLCD